MKFWTACTIIGIAITVFVAGCSSPIPVSTPLTPVPTVTPIPTPVPQQAVNDPLLLGTWNLKVMSIQAGTVPTIPGSQITIAFYDQGTLSGFAGCNNYNGPYMLTGSILPSGKSISIGPIISTQNFCAGSSDTEATYTSILQKATSYTVNGDGLTITDNLNNKLIYQR